MACRMGAGMAGSNQTVMGVTGSDSAAAGSFFSSRQRVTHSVSMPFENGALKSLNRRVETPMRGSATRGV